MSVRVRLPSAGDRAPAPARAMPALLAAATVLGALAPVPAAAQVVRPAREPGPPARVALMPPAPVQGTLFGVRVEAEGDVAWVEGRFAGEPLHFEEVSRGEWWALAAVPISARGERELPVVVRRPRSADTVRVAVPVREGSYRVERLTVAPEFGREPDEALRERMRREAERARAVSERAHRTPRLWDPPFVMPRDARVTSRYGDGREFNGRIQSRHMGTDLAGDVGAPVRVAANGVVALVDSFYLGGNVVYVDHGAGLVTAYLHLSETLVSEGQAVSAGAVIGRVGATGRVTGPHLHWIARYGSVTVNAFSLPGLEAGPPGDLAR